MDWPYIDGGDLMIPVGPVDFLGVPLWFVGIVALALVMLATLVVVVIAAAMSNKRRRRLETCD